MNYDVQSVDYILTTTRSVRKRLDFTRPVEREIIQECLEIAIQAPTGSNAQGWKWLLVTDPHKREQIAHYYRQSWESYSRQFRAAASGEAADTPAARMVSSAQYLADNLQKAPMYLIPCIRGRVENADPGTQAGLYGSILPAVWSFMLALRARGIGSAWTTLHLAYEKECAEILGIPDRYTQAALLPIAYFKGDTFKPARRIPAAELTYWDEWGNTEG